MTPEQREKLTDEQLAEYDALPADRQSHWDELVTEAERLENLPDTEKIDLLMALVSKLILTSNALTDRFDQLVDVTNHHSQVIQLVLTTVNGGGLTQASNTKPPLPTPGQYL